MSNTMKIVLAALAVVIVLVIGGCAIFGSGSEEPGDVSAPATSG
jgi:hypothetical protein